MITTAVTAGVVTTAETGIEAATGVITEVAMDVGNLYSVPRSRTCMSAPFSRHFHVSFRCVNYQYCKIADL